VALASLEDILFFLCFIPTLLLLTGKWDLLLSTGLQEHLVAHRFWFLGLALGAILLIWGSSCLLGRYSMLRWPFFRHSRKRQHWLWQFRRSFREFRGLFRQIVREGKLPFLFSMLALVFQWLCRLSVLAALILALGLEVNWLELWLLQWLLFISMLFVPTPGATGGAEAAFILLFGALLPQKLIGLLAAAWRLLTYYFILLLALLLLYLTRSRAPLQLAN
ncbi:MAG: flippase-like domain-containing protein, partial [Bacteroidota bacterium]